MSFNPKCHHVKLLQLATLPKKEFRFKDKAFDALLSFARNVKNCVQNVTFSVVRETLTEDEIKECQRIADECGVLLRVRDYISG